VYNSFQHDFTSNNTHRPNILLLSQGKAIVVVLDIWFYRPYKRLKLTNFTILPLISERELTSVACRLSSVCNVREIFGNVLHHLVRKTSIDFEVKFYGDRPRGTSPSAGEGVKPKRNSQI